MCSAGFPKAHGAVWRVRCVCRRKGGSKKPREKAGRAGRERRKGEGRRRRGGGKARTKSVGWGWGAESRRKTTISRQKEKVDKEKNGGKSVFFTLDARAQRQRK